MPSPSQKQSKPEPFAVKIESAQCPLVGRCFHSLDGPDGVIEWQGEVIGKVEQGLYLIRLFNWIDGGDSLQRLIPIDEMRHWLFYDNHESMNWHYREGSARRYRDDVRRKERPPDSAV